MSCLRRQLWNPVRWSNGGEPRWRGLRPPPPDRMAQPAAAKGDGGAPAPPPALAVRKDLYPSVKLPKLSPVSCVKLETDFEQSIDEIATQKRMQLTNGREDSPPRESRKRRSEDGPKNGFSDAKRSKSSKERIAFKPVPPRHIKGGKNLNMLQREVAREPVAPKGGKPFSHRMNQLPPHRGKPSIGKVTALESPKSGKPRSMMGMGSSVSKKKQNTKKLAVETYHSQISEDTNTIKIKIRKASSQIQVTFLISKSSRLHFTYVLRSSFSCRGGFYSSDFSPIFVRIQTCQIVFSYLAIVSN